MGLTFSCGACWWLLVAWAGNQVELLGGSGSLSGGATVKSEMSQEGAGVLPPPPDQVISVHQSWKTWKELCWIQICSLVHHSKA